VKGKRNISMTILLLSSIFFYSWWDITFTPLLFLSIVVNFCIGRMLIQLPEGKTARRILVLSICFNLILIGWYKYANFFFGEVTKLSGFKISSFDIVLPLAISFFTFQQIGYVVDCYKNKVKKYNFLEYACFVAFFPQLIAGPIVQHHELMPQFGNTLTKQIIRNINIGTMFFVIGLFKKVCIADSLADLPNQVFATAEQGQVIGLMDAWTASLAYSLQLYFDFSGYSDMAIGLGRMFGLQLPVNFFSPYHAKSVVEFWTRWHITLSRFLRHYFYIPMGGSRHGNLRRYCNIFLTMALCGLWHGAGWTFVLWGIYHAIGIIINHVWRDYFVVLFVVNSHIARRIYSFLAWAITILFVVNGWVLFRAESLKSAILILKSMYGFDGFALPSYIEGRSWLFDSLANVFGVSFSLAAQTTTGFDLMLVGIIGFGALTLPNTNVIMRRLARPMLDTEFRYSSFTQLRLRLTILSALILAFLFVPAMISISTTNEFLYFQF